MAGNSIQDLIWSLGFDVTIVDIDSTIQEVKVNDITLSGILLKEELSVDIDYDRVNVMDLDVNVVVDGINSSIVESQVVTYDRIKEINDLSPESTYEKGFASSAKASKKIYDLYTALNRKHDILNGNVERLEEVVENLENNPVVPDVPVVAESYWKLGADGKIYSDYDIYVRGNAIIEGDTASGGEGGASSLAQLNDVILNSLSNGDVLIYDKISEKWYNAPQSDIVPDLDGLAKEEDLETLALLLSSMWTLSEDKTTIVATKDVRIKANLVVEKDTSSGGEGQDTPPSGVTPEELNEALLNYYTKQEVDTKIAQIDLSEYATKSDVSGEILDLSIQLKEWVNEKGYISGVDSEMVIDALGYIPLSTLGGTITGQLNVGNINGYTPITSGNIGSQSVNKANILATARTLWGNSFDGSKDITGHITLGNEIALKCKTTDGTARNAILINAANHLFVGSEMAGIGDTYITGNSIYFRYGANKTVGIKLNSSGYLGVNTTNPAYNLDVNGTARFSDAVTMSSTFTAVGGTISGQLNVSNINGYTPITSANIGSQSVSFANSSDKLSTARTIWGQSFDGSGNVSGALSGVTNIGMTGYVSGVSYINDNTTNGFIFGSRSVVGAAGGALIYTYGNTPILFYTGGAHRMLVNSSGNVTIGDKDLAGTSYTMYVSGNARVKDEALVGSLKIGTPSDNYNAILKMDGSSLSIDRELKLLAGGTSDICPSIAASFKAKIAQVQNLITNNVIIGASSGTASNLAFNVQKYTSVSSQAPAGLTTLFSIGTDGKVTFNGEVVVNGNLIVTGDTASGNAGSNSGGATSLDWSAITSKPTTLAGYGITDAVSTAGGTFNGEITALNLAISNTGTGYHLQFKRGGGNIIWCPSGGYYRIVCNGAGTSDGDATMLVKSGTVSVKGNLSASGTVTNGSDIRFKDIIDNKTIRIEDIANAPLFTFKWNDREDDTIHMGSSAQYWENIVPELVIGEGFKTMDYSTLGVGIGISLAKKAIDHEARIKALEEENKSLKEKLYGC